MEPQEKFLSSRLNLLLIESETEELEQTNISLISESLRIQSFVDEHIISTLTIEYFSFRQIEDQLFCKFIKTQTYFITCIKVIDYYGNHRLNQLNEQSIISIELNELKGIECHEFFINLESQFILICFHNFHLQIYCIDQDNKMNLLSQHEINQQQYEMCKRKYFKLDDNQYIISFYQCKTWGLYIYWQQKIKELVNEELAKPVQISYLENVQICQYRLYLISEFGYYQFLMTKTRQVELQIFFEFPANFRYLLLTSNCFFYYYVHYNQSINKTVIFHKSNEFIASFEGTDVQIRLMESILFAKTHSQLKVMYNQECQQIIQLNTSHINFDNNYNLIYWLDESTKELIFYKISYPRNFVQPTQKYIFQVNNYHIQNSQTKICFEMKYIIEKQYNKIQTLDFNYQCQNESSIFYSKEGLELPNKYEIKLDQNLDLKLNILDQYSFKFLCPKHQNFNQQDTILLYYEANANTSFSMIQTEDYIYFQNCHNASKSRVDIQNCQIFYFQSYLLLHNQNKQEFKLISLQRKLIKKFKIQVEITEILQCQQIILIFTSGGEDPKVINIQHHQQMLLNEQTNKILNTIHQIYLQNKLKNQILTPNHFFFSLENPKLIQYNQYLIILIRKKVQIFRLENIQIIFLKELLNQQFQFLGVHQINNQLNSYYFDLLEISEVYSFNLDNYKLIRPIKYQINTRYLALASLSQNKTYILIFEIRLRKPLMLVKVIQTSRIEFFFQGHKLFYYNFEDEVMIYNLEYFEFQFQDPIEYNEIAIKTNVTFQIISETKSNPAISLGFTLKGYNKCYQLFQKSNHSSIDSTQKQIIPSKYFYGSIDRLKIEDSEETDIIGPLIFIEWVYDNIQERRIKKIDIGPIIYNNQSSNEIQSINIVLAENDFGQTFIIHPIYLLFAKVLPINKQQILIFFVDQTISKSLKGALYSINEESQHFRQQPIFEINITLDQSHKEYLVLKTG
ncbi:unnamed protein product (macronuclear) [Paramecium tetraurelia]|uniref:Cleavage/polyadenylation specificity factor A subunit N-terminal domain-containing protein n=1 Tax=Paramecium tetraurelia TaxID=5888 RepID=A0E313_PARTE|nr:uncharacterized protein GSPATT00022853001 [Paramecium tetraurelia]CAK89680.1 unnamed protein product [Paramecium tetraurelia]|eukprot:XP_001457077.1 hypothetical protein (macronuclear) [Paramecium tetraurelia strain d4-2]